MFLSVGGCDGTSGLGACASRIQISSLSQERVIVVGATGWEALHAGGQRLLTGLYLLRTALAQAARLYLASLRHALNAAASFWARS